MDPINACFRSVGSDETESGSVSYSDKMLKVYFILIIVPKTILSINVKYEQPVQVAVKEESTAYPKYHFEYGVKDEHTGDVKEQYEERDGDAVKGEYTLLEPDGTIRKVQYQDDGHSGFNAIVTKTGQAVHPSEPAKQPVHQPYASYLH